MLAAAGGARARRRSRPARVAGLFDEPAKLAIVDVLSRLRAGAVVDALFVGRAVRAVHVVGAEVQRDLAHLEALYHPVRFDMIEVMEHQARRCEHADVVEPGGPAAVAEFVAVGMERQRNECVEAGRALLRLAQRDQVLDALL